MNEIAATPAGEAETSWHALSGEETLARLATSSGGLSHEEARQRLERHGPNRLPEPPRRSALRRFLAQFQNLLIYVLLAAAVGTAALGEWKDTIVILGVVVINAIIGFVQEGKAEAALEAIRAMLSPKATVLRDGERTMLPAEDLVPGDLVFLQSGDRVPADLRLIQVTNLRCEEAALTGESVPVDKDAQPVAADASLGDRRSMAYSSTLVAYGQGTGVVVATGPATEIGRIGRLLEGVQTLATPLTRQLDQLARRLTVIILVLSAAVFAFGILVWGFPPVEMLMAAIGIAVAAIPEGLPAVMTIALALGVQRMARRNAIVRHLPAVETLGAVTVICSDKTGTLTKNEMTVRTVATAEGDFAVTGTGYAPEGEMQQDGRPLPEPARERLIEIARAGLLCNEARLERAERGWRLIGDPTEGALITLAMKLGLDPAAEAAACPRRATIPFESERQYMATLNAGGEEGQVLVKGAVERVLPMCARERRAAGEAPIDHAAWERRMERLAASGQRVLAAAAKPVEPGRRELATDEAVQGDLVLLGLFGLIDPPRPEAVEAVAQCQGAGITVKMITGDHAVTARAIAREIGLAHDEVVTGGDLATLDDKALEEHAARADVFARVAPEQKLRLVEALQRRGEIVAMTGDGVNDAPALKRAEIGVAMGARGTEAAKEAAKIVLADDNFASIAHAVEEGRVINDNLKKTLVFTLPTNGGQAVTIIAGILLGTQLPITPLQILWVNMVTAVTLGLALAFEPGEAGVMARPPQQPRAPLLGRLLFGRVVLVSLLIAAGSFGAFLLLEHGPAGPEYARTVAVNMLVAFEIFYLFSCQRLSPPAFSLKELGKSRAALVATGLVILLQLLFTYAPPFQALFDTRPLALTDWLYVIPIAATVLLLVELGEHWLERRGR